MGSFPALPALQVRPAPDPIEQLMRITSLQTGQAQAQQAQQQLADQRAVTAAMRSWDGKDINDLYPLVLTNGGSANAVLGLKSTLLAQQEKFSTIAKNDAETGAKRIETMQKANDSLAGHLNTLDKVPDDQLVDAGNRELAAARNGGYIDPAHATVMDNLLATNDPTKIRPALDLFRKGLMTESQQLDEATKMMTAQGAAARGQAALGELALRQKQFDAQTDPNSPLYDPKMPYLVKQAKAGDQDALSVLGGLAAQAGAKAGAEAKARFPWEARLEQMRQQGDPVFAYDPINKQTVQVSRAEAQKAGYSNIVKVGQPEIDKAKTSAMQLGDATMNIQAYKQASQRMDELSGSDIATVSRVIGSDQFKAHFLGLELPVDWANKLYQTKGWTDMPEAAKDAVVNYLAARPAAISLLRAINPGVRLTESQIATELKNIPDPTTPSDIRDRQFARLDRNIDQASKTLVKIPGVDLPSEIRDRVASQAPAAPPQGAATGQYKNARGNPMQVGQEAYDFMTKRYLGKVSKVYRDGSYDLQP